MKTACNSGWIVLQPDGRRSVEVTFDGGRISDEGALLLHAEDNAIGVTQPSAEYLSDFWEPSRGEHDVRTLVGQPVPAIARGTRKSTTTRTCVRTSFLEWRLATTTSSART